MFKKIMAVALTAVMAVSMLTGCAVSDAVAKSQLKDAMNKMGATTDRKYTTSNNVTIDNTKYELSSKADKMVKEINKEETTKAEDLQGKVYVEAEEGYLYVVAFAPKSGDNKYMKQADAVNKALTSYAKYTGTKAPYEVTVCMKNGTTKSAKTDGKAYDYILIVAAYNGAVIPEV